jgi:hypothetical protein
MRFLFSALLLVVSFVLVDAQDVILQDASVRTSISGREIFFEALGGGGTQKTMMIDDDGGAPKGRPGANTVREPNRCSMYDTCGKKGGIFGQDIPCADNTVAPEVRIVQPWPCVLGHPVLRTMWRVRVSISGLSTDG